MPRTGDIQHVQIVRFDQSIKMDIEKVQARSRAPMPQQPRFEVSERERNF